MLNHPPSDRSFPALLLLSFSLLSSVYLQGTQAQSASHPEAKSPLPENKYLKHTDPWRWDIRSQVFLRAGIRYYSNRNASRDSYSEQAESIWWPMKDLEVIFPVVREGGFYWSPNLEVTASIRAGDFEREQIQERMYTKNTKAEYTLWRSEVQETVHQIHLIHTSHIVVADTVFDHKLAQFLPWPDTWADEASAFLSPVIDSVGKDVEGDADDTIETLLNFWVENKDPKMLSELDLVKFLTGKVIEHVKVQGPPSEFTSQTVNRVSAVSVVGGTTWLGFVVRQADEIAKDPKGSKHDLAILLTSILRSAGVPARTVLCVKQTEDDVLEKLVSMVEFAMYDPETDLTFWVPIDIDRLRLNGKRASQYKQWWNYFGTHDELNDYVPVAYYFHPPASYAAYDLPALYGIRSSSPLPDYAIQSILVDPLVSPVSIPAMQPKP
jgi:hypothetical protein